jgi:hypothetical protein
MAGPATGRPFYFVAARRGFRRDFDGQRRPTWSSLYSPALRLSVLRWIPRTFAAHDWLP